MNCLTNHTDTELVALSRSAPRRDAAMEELGARTHRYALAAALEFARRFGGTQDADDVATISAVKALNAIGRYDSSRCSWATWVSTIARRTFVDLRRSEARRGRLATRFLEYFISSYGIQSEDSDEHK